MKSEQISKIERNESLSEQTERLAKFIMEEIDGEPSKGEGAVDCAIRVIRKLNDDLKSAIDTSKMWHRRVKELEKEKQIILMKYPTCGPSTTPLEFIDPGESETMLEEDKRAEEI